MTNKEKPKKGKTASVHNIDIEEYLQYRIDAVKKGFSSASKYFLHLIREGKKAEETKNEK